MDHDNIDPHIRANPTYYKQLQTQILQRLGKERLMIHLFTTYGMSQSIGEDVIYVMSAIADSDFAHKIV